ncbi:hypothetical protein PI125_g13698 [Phytophthora idaei]|nr:hypothetical protein PI125_g13698 [Phytophthora idaei]
MTDLLVGRLKAQLKRSLRKHVGEAVNDVCDAFVDELKPIDAPPLAPTLTQIGTLKNEVDYDCCRQLVEYIVRNMDTSPGFAQQMDCVILAYQSNASVDILNSVVNQNMWVRRRCVQDTGGERETLNKFKASTELQTELKDNDTNPGTILEGGNVGAAASLASGKLPSTSGVDSLKVKSAEVAAKSSKGQHSSCHGEDFGFPKWSPTNEDANTPE